MGRVVEIGQLEGLRDRLRADGRSIVLTNGHFDLLHTGHLRYLEAASTLGDVLIVGINDDRITAARKGPRRPIQSEQERAELVAALNCVDYTVIFREETAHRLIELIQPDTYAKGGDYSILPDKPGTPLPELDAVHQVGGEVRILPLEPEQSTSAIEQRIIERWIKHGREEP